jgi:hypothetical protein
MSKTLDIPKGLEDAVCEYAANIGDGSFPDWPCADLNEDLWTEEDTHPWTGWTWGHHLWTKCTYAQTLESPAEYETYGRIWLDYDGKTVIEWNASDLW